MSLTKIQLRRLIRESLEDTCLQFDIMADLHKLCSTNSDALSSAEWESILEIPKIHLEGSKFNQAVHAFDDQDPDLFELRTWNAIGSIQLIPLAIRSTQDPHIESICAEMVPILELWLVFTLAHCEFPSNGPIQAITCRGLAHVLMTLLQNRACRLQFSSTYAGLLGTIVDCCVWLSENRGKEGLETVGALLNTLSFFVNEGTNYRHTDVPDALAVRALDVCTERAADIAGATMRHLMHGSPTEWEGDGYDAVLVLSRAPGFSDELCARGFPGYASSRLFKLYKGNLSYDATLVGLKRVFMALLRTTRWMNRGLPLIQEVLDKRLLICTLTFLVAYQSESDYLVQIQAEVFEALHSHALFPSLRSTLRKSMRRIDHFLQASQLVMPQKYVSMYADIQAAALNPAPFHVYCTHPLCPLRLSPNHDYRLQRCFGCQSVLYCSAKCQREHWQRQHRVHCRQIQKARDRKAANVPATVKDVAAIHQHILRTNRTDALQAHAPLLLINLPNLTPQKCDMEYFLDSRKLYMHSDEGVDHLRGIIESRRSEGSEETPIVIMVHSSWIVDVTNAERIRFGVYEPQIFTV
ncbi:hypothetical protein CYLTODRAFT_441867 [Cylindrobasidium torrendii FP15055 ss-10]|uniref:MYND-type domain-containing protein n=1 Tax=Cylindrobasidium torrendii FP15055 ss-10 TaxID=1314674 RepID=A0A0D7BJB5_9AGAR|nr:hypothetical protein CYLTODRAFT_441867 [Cylindrobasidium torrendii FP15055 ss-10]